MRTWQTWSKRGSVCIKWLWYLSAWRCSNETRLEPQFASVSFKVCVSCFFMAENVAKCNLGKVNLEAMLVSSFSSYAGGWLNASSRGSSWLVYAVACLQLFVKRYRNSLLLACLLIDMLWPCLQVELAYPYEYEENYSFRRDDQRLAWMPS